MEENKKVILSGKLSGTRTFSSYLEQIENPDEIEKFLLYFSNLKINTEILAANEIIYIDNEQHFEEINNELFSSKYISIYTTDNFSNLYITSDINKTYILNLQTLPINIVANIVSNEQLIKYIINSFSFIKWCNSNNIEIKSLFDIPTYIKLLTNDVDPFKTEADYFSQYVNSNRACDTTEITGDDENMQINTKFKTDFNINTIEKENILISNFIAYFGSLLSEYIEKFDLAIVSKLINENNYYEGNSFNETGNCIISVDLLNINTAISNIESEISAQYSNNAYIISPLNRIAPKFKQDVSSLIHEMYLEDFSIAILNELYNNNIPVKFDYQNNKYIVTCRFKNFSNVITIISAIFSEAFYAIFNQSPEMHIDCIIKE